VADKESDGTVVLAGTANLAIAVAKAVAGLLSGSTALLAEAAHSAADTLNQAFLLTALHRSRKPADARHPFGYGMERYFWSLLAAVGILVLGAGFSITEGVRAILHPEPIAALAVIYPVLAVSFLFEGASWLRAIFQLRREAREAGVPFLQQLRSAEPAVKTGSTRASGTCTSTRRRAIRVSACRDPSSRRWPRPAAARRRRRSSRSLPGSRTAVRRTTPG
jgi:cation diffusion facilitator family transporter